MNIPYEILNLFKLNQKTNPLEIENFWLSPKSKVVVFSKIHQLLSNISLLEKSWLVLKRMTTFEFCPSCHRDFRTLEAMERHISAKHEVYQFQPKNPAPSHLPPIVPKRELEAAKQFYADKFITSFPRLWLYNRCTYKWCMLIPTLFTWARISVKPVFLFPLLVFYNVRCIFWSKKYQYDLKMLLACQVGALVNVLAWPDTNFDIFSQTKGWGGITLVVFYPFLGV